MKINAQVTAVIALFEAFANSLMIAFVLIFKVVGYNALLQNIFLYFVILPYAFLMNTSHNKDRIIEDGWNNVFNNVFRICCKKSPSIGNEIENIAQVNVHPKPSMSDTLVSVKTKVNNKNDILEQNVSNNAINSGNLIDNDLRIFRIFGNRNIVSPVNDNINMVPLNVPIDEQPCSSKHGITNDDSNLSSDSEDMPNKYNWKYLSYLRFKIISEMLSNTSKESLYINCFQQFVSFEDALKNGDDISELVQNIAFKNHNSNSDKKGRITASENYIVNEKLRSNEIKLCVQSNYELEDDEEDGMGKLNFAGNSENRIEMRKKMLNRLLQHFETDEDMYDECVEMFVNMEENFVV